MARHLTLVGGWLLLSLSLAGCCCGRGGMGGCGACGGCSAPACCNPCSTAPVVSYDGMTYYNDPSATGQTPTLAAQPASPSTAKPATTR